MSTPGRRPVKLIGAATALVVGLLAVVPITGASADTAADQREVKRKKAEVAAQVDTLKATDAQLDAALADLQANVRATQAAMNDAQAQVDAATVFTREWRFLEEPERSVFRAERRRYEARWHELLRDAAERGALRADLDVDAAVLLVLSAANWAYTWLRPGADTDALADRFFAILGDGMSSRLFLSVREARGLAYDVSSGLVDYADAGALEVSAGVDPDKLPEAIEAILAELARLPDEPVEADRGGRFTHLVVARLGPAEAHVVGDGA